MTSSHQEAHQEAPTTAPKHPNLVFKDHPVLSKTISTLSSASSNDRILTPRKKKNKNKKNTSSEDSTFCRYQSKRCYNPRVLKKNGKFHNLCSVHRLKANSNQRKLDRKKRRDSKSSSSYGRSVSADSGLASNHQARAGAGPGLEYAHQYGGNMLLGSDFHHGGIPMNNGRPGYGLLNRSISVAVPGYHHGQQQHHQQLPGHDSLSVDDFNFLVDCFSHGPPQTQQQGPHGYGPRHAPQPSPMSRYIRQQDPQQHMPQQPHLSSSPWQTFLHDEWQKQQQDPEQPQYQDHAPPSSAGMSNSGYDSGKNQDTSGPHRISVKANV